mgnify:FL=1
MSTTLYRLGHWAVRRRRLVVVLWLVGLLLAGATAAALQRGVVDVFEIPGTQSQQALDSLTARFPEFAGASGQVVVQAPDGMSVRDPDVRARIDALTKQYATAPYVDAAIGPFDEHIKGAVSSDGHAAIISVQLDVPSVEVTDAIRAPIVAITTASTQHGLRAEVGGSLFMPTPPAVTISEGIGVLVALIVLVMTFGSAFAAGIPLLTATAGVAASVAAIFAATRFTDVTSTAPFLALMIGLAVGIDYALFILSRHRDLLAEGLAPDEAAAQATGTAGSAVVFAGATVAVALAALGVAGIPFLSTMGMAAAGSVAAAVLVSLTLLPALLGLGGSRLMPRKVADDHHARHHTGVWAGWVRTVTKVPLLTALLVIAGLTLLALPARDLTLALPHNGTSAPTSTQRKAYDLVAEKFGPGANAPFVVTLDIVASTDPLGLVAAVEKRVLATDGIVSTTLATPNRAADTGVIIAIPDAAADTERTKATLEHVRALAPTIKAEYGADMAVTGQTAAQVDVSQRLYDALLPFGLVVVGISLILLTLVFRSLLVPITAALGYVLSVGAAFGVVAAVFRWGWASSLMGLNEPGPVISFMPIIVMGVLFGLAMDYQVFLVSSMRARFVHEGDAQRAVNAGFVDSARVVTAAAVIMVSVFAAFVPHGAVYIKPIALGLAVGVFVDAFLVRMTLIPAVMRLLGPRAWWLPAWLDRRLPVLDIEGESLHRRLALAAARGGAAPAAVLARDLSRSDGLGTVYAGVDLDTPRGAMVVVRGGSGAGKTALLLTLAGRMTPSAGRLEVNGHLLPDAAAAVRREVSLTEIAGVNDLDPLLTVADHVDERLATTTWHPWVSGRDRTEALRRLDTLAAAAAAARPDAHLTATLEPRLRVRELTAIQRWVLALGLALVGDPAILVTDDVDALPSAADRVAAWSLLASLSRDRVVTVIASCHDLPHDVEALDGIPMRVVDLGAGRTGPAWALTGPTELDPADPLADPTDPLTELTAEKVH